MQGIALLAAAVTFAAQPEHARAQFIEDPEGDILPTYTGPHHPGMDVVAHEVTLKGDHLIFFGRMAGPIAPTQEIGALYLFGVDRGRGTPRFLNAPAAPPVIGPSVTWDLIVRINPNGTGLVNNVIAGISTPLPPANIRISGNEFVAIVPLHLLLPAATRPPHEWTYNLWPRNGVGLNVQVSDLAPDDGNSPVTSGMEIQEPINADGSSVFNVGQTLPMKFQFVGISAGITDVGAALSYRYLGTADAPITEADAPLVAVDGAFRYDAEADQFILNWNTRGLEAGRYLLLIRLDDATTHRVMLTLE